MVSSKDNYIFMFYSLAMDANFREFLRLRGFMFVFCFSICLSGLVRISSY